MLRINLPSHPCVPSRPRQGSFIPDLGPGLCPDAVVMATDGHHGDTTPTAVRSPARRDYPTEVTIDGNAATAADREIGKQVRRSR